MRIQIVLILSYCMSIHSFYLLHDFMEVYPTHCKPVGTIVLFHGVGDTGPRFKRWIDLIMGKDKLFHDMHLIFPTAPLLKPKYFRELQEGSTEGKIHNAWFDKHYYVYEGKEDVARLYRICTDVMSILKNESRYKISNDKTFFGGFGMGGNVAMHLGFRFMPEARGIFAMSTFLKRFSCVYRVLKGYRSKKQQKKIKPPELFYCVGERDNLVDAHWVAKTIRGMKKQKVPLKVHSMPHLFHEMNKEELLEVEKWVTNRIHNRLSEEESFDYEAYADQIEALKKFANHFNSHDPNSTTVWSDVSNISESRCSRCDFYKSGEYSSQNLSSISNDN